MLHLVVHYVLLPPLVHDSFVWITDFDELAQNRLDLCMEELVLHDCANTLDIDDSSEDLKELQITDLIKCAEFGLEVADHELLGESDGAHQVLLLFDYSGPGVEQEHVE